MGDIGFTATWPADPKWNERDIDYVQLINDEAIRLERDEREMLLDEYINFDTGFYERLTSALCKQAGVERDAEIDDLFMEVARKVADEAVNNPKSYYWRQA